MAMVNFFRRSFFLYVLHYFLLTVSVSECHTIKDEIFHFIHEEPHRRFTEYDSQENGLSNMDLAKYFSMTVTKK